MKTENQINTELRPKFQFTKVHGFLLSVLIALAVHVLPTGLAPNAHLALVISVWTVAMWVFNVFPIEITAILFSVLMVVLKILPPPKAFGGYADPTTWFMMAVLLFGIAVTDTGLGKRVSLNLGRIFGSSFKGMLFALILTGFVLSFLTPAGVERVLIVYPIAIGTAIAIMGASMPGSNVTKLCMSIGYIAGNTFGFGLLTGTSVNILSVGVIKQVTGITIFWGQWATWFLLPVVITGFISMYILYRMYPPERTEMIGGSTKLYEELAAMGPMKARERKTLIYLIIAVVLWITDFWHGLPPWAVAVFVAVLMTAPVIGCLGAEDLKKLPLTVIVFTGASITLGIVMQETGVGTWMGKVTLGHLITPDMSSSVASAITFLVAGVLHFPLVESKTTIAGLVPVVVNYFQGAGMPILGPTLMTCMAGSAIAFVPFMVLPSLLMVGFGPHFTYRHAVITVSTYSIVTIVIQLICCFTWYRWVGLM